MTNQVAAFHKTFSDCFAVSAGKLSTFTFPSVAHMHLHNRCSHVRGLVGLTEGCIAGQNVSNRQMVVSEPGMTAQCSSYCTRIHSILQSAFVHKSCRCVADVRVAQQCMILER